jgi:hypothetical protein
VVERLRKMLGTTIRALSVIVEARDPYTAGHQARGPNCPSIATAWRLPRKRSGDAGRPPRPRLITSPAEDPPCKTPTGPASDGHVKTIRSGSTRS